MDRPHIGEGRPLSAENGARSVDNQVTQTVRRLEKMIQSGQLPAGRMLPSQRLLAEQLNVGRSSLREALSILETLGVVQTQPRLGTLVREPAPDDPKPEWRLEGTYSPEEVYQFRIVIESYAARRTAINATPDQIAELRKICDLMREAAREGDLLGYTEQDFAFHQRIMSFSDNRLFVDLHQRYGAVFRESQRMPLAWHRALWEPLAEHENIIRAIENRDPENASYFARVHLVRGADRIGVMLSDSV